MLIYFDPRRFFTVDRKSNSSESREISVMDAIRWITEHSDFGRWLDATIGVMRDRSRFLLVASELQRRHLESGDIVVKGRRSGSIDYNDIDRRFWEHAFIHVETHPLSIFRATIMPSEASTIFVPDYDRLIVDRTLLESKFPEWVLRIRLAIAILSIRANIKAFKTAIKTAIEKVEPTHVIIFGLVIALDDLEFVSKQSS
jgi:hypothetical protein